MTDRPLGGLKVLVTRPEHQAEHLCQLIEAQGGQVERLPALRILPLAGGVAGDRLAQVGHYDVIIFISTNAVRHALPWLPATPWHRFPPQILAVGRATAEIIRAVGLPLAWTPRERFDSEALLASPALSAVDGKRVLIVRGEGGRTLLGQTLATRGAQVDYAEVYRRVLAHPVDDRLFREWHQRVAVTTATSNDLLDSLWTLAGETAQPLLRETPLVVISRRMAEHACQLGFRAIYQASQAGDEAIVECLCARWGHSTTAPLPSSAI